MNETEAAVVDVVPEAEIVVKVRKPRANSPTDVQFADAWNASESRKEVLERLEKAGTPMSYSAMAARHASYVTKGVNLKEIAPAQRGRKTNVSALNEHIAQSTVAAAVTE